MGGFTDLPEDVVIEILSWLAPRTLQRFKSVDKSFNVLVNTLIKSPWFVAKHLRNSSEKKPILAFENEYECDVESGFFSIFDNKKRQALGCVCESLKSVVGDEYYKEIGADYSLNSHCNGIICLVHDPEDTIMLCNPATREFKLLPFDVDGDRDNTFCARVGFGYDPVDSIYKVVRIFGTMYVGDFRAQVCTLGSRVDCWREIKLPGENLPAEVLLCSERRGEFYVKGVYYWLENETITSFDIHNEEFRSSIPIPDNHKPCETHLLLWNESLALFLSPIDDTSKPIEMWVMRDSGSHKRSGSSWIKHLSIGAIHGGIFKNPKQSNFTPLVFQGSDELLIKESCGRLFSYNLLTHKCSEVKRDVEGLSDDFRAYHYVKSLVSVLHVEEE